MEDSDWDPGFPLPNEHVIISRTAVYHYADQPEFVNGRRALDKAVEAYYRAVNGDPSSDPTQMASQLVADGHRLDHADCLALFAPIAATRILFRDIGVTFAEDYVSIMPGGITKSHKLMHNPVFARAMSETWRLTGEPEMAETLLRVASCSGGFKALNQLLHEGSNPEDLVLTPPFVPEESVSDDEIQGAIQRHMAEFKTSTTAASHMFFPALRQFE